MDLPAIITLAIVIGAALALGWRTWRKLRGKGACGCDHCPTKQPPL